MDCLIILSWVTSWYYQLNVDVSKSNHWSLLKIWKKKTNSKSLRLMDGKLFNIASLFVSIDSYFFITLLPVHVISQTDRKKETNQILFAGTIVAGNNRIPEQTRRNFMYSGTICQEQILSTVRNVFFCHCHQTVFRVDEFLVSERIHNRNLWSVTKEDKLRKSSVCKIHTKNRALLAAHERVSNQFMVNSCSDIKQPVCRANFTQIPYISPTHVSVRQHSPIEWMMMMIQQQTFY